MCGIIGYGGIQDGIDIQTLIACRDALAHRGPDAAGHWISEDRRVALAHRRLAILDLSAAGEQPMLSTNKDLALVFNGEIYNHSDLRNELAGLGKTFRGRSDTEVLLCAYEQWGIDCLRRLRGMFAFCIYDKSRNSLILARDRAGEKPLYWARHRSGFVFASELKALMADATFVRRVDLQSLDSYLAFGYVPHDRCLLRGASKVPPGHWLEISLRDGSIKTEQYWKLPSSREAVEEDGEILVDELHELLASSVREQLEADVPVAVLLSGGTDSSLITAIAANSTASAVSTFSVGFPGFSDHDERVHARRVASHFGTRHTELTIEESAINLVEALAFQYDEPIADSSIIPTFLLSQLVSKHCKVVLGGDAGDELFGGYQAYRGAVRLSHWRENVPLPIRASASLLAKTMLPPGFPNRNGLIGLGGSMSDCVARMGLMYDQSFRERIIPRLRDLQSKDSTLKWKASIVETERGVPGAFMAADFSTYLPEDILVKVDRASMANSLEVRSPFLDARIIEFAFGRVPNHLRATKDARKILLKQLARRVLPKEFDVDRKQGFSIPLTKWLPSSLRNAMCDKFEATLGSVFNFNEVRRLMSSEHVGSVSRSFGLLLLMEWMLAYKVSID